MLVTSIFSFSHNVFERLPLQGLQKSGLSGKDLNYIKVVILKCFQFGSLVNKQDLPSDLWITLPEIDRNSCSKHANENVTIMSFIQQTKMSLSCIHYRFTKWSVFSSPVKFGEEMFNNITGKAQMEVHCKFCFPNNAFHPKTNLNKMCLWNTNAPETAIFWEM